jgi:hypothetical protein
MKEMKIFGAWTITTILFSSVATALSMYFHDQPSDASERLSLLKDIYEMLIINPIGFLLSLLTPVGWVMIFGLGYALIIKSYKPLLISAVGAAIFGYYWPLVFWAVMSV